MKKILVPCDFSEPAIQAFRFAIDVAAKSKGIVHLLYVAEPPVSNEPILMPMVDLDGRQLEELRSKTAVEFNTITSKYFNEIVKVISEMEFGTPSRKILDYIVNHSIDLVIMGSHGASGLREIFIGSNAEKIVRNASVPVLVLKNYVKGPIKNIVFPNTFEIENQEDLVAKIKGLQEFFQAQLHLLWINTPFNLISESVIQDKLHDFASHYGMTNYSIHVISQLNEEGGILKYTKSINGDLIAMGTHGRKGINHLLVGSVAEDVVNHADRIIWTYMLKNELAGT